MKIVRHPVRHKLLDAKTLTKKFRMNYYTEGYRRDDTGVSLPTRCTYLFSKNVPLVKRGDIIMKKDLNLSPVVKTYLPETKYVVITAVDVDQDDRPLKIGTQLDIELVALDDVNIETYGELGHVGYFLDLQRGVKDDKTMLEEISSSGIEMPALSAWLYLDMIHDNYKTNLLKN